MNKYGASKVYQYEDGFCATSKQFRNHGKIVEKFDSEGEFNRYYELRLLEKAGAISDLKRQVPFELIPRQKSKNGEIIPAVKYVADFTYLEDGQYIVEDFKGMKTDVYKLKKKMLMYRYGLEIRES